MDKWPFEIWLEFAVKSLRLSPSEFWAMSVCDWLILCTQKKGRQLERTTLEKLMQSFPDMQNEDKND